jgi:hypothetical protein
MDQYEHLPSAGHDDFWDKSQRALNDWQAVQWYKVTLRPVALLRF